MPVSEPRLEPIIESKVHACMRQLQKDVSGYHVDGSVQLVGILRSGLGAKILISNLESTREEEIQIWQQVAFDTGAVKAEFVADFNNGQIHLDIEYKRPLASNNYCEWLMYPTLLMVLTLSLKLL
jgi:hypothetical protein